MCEKHVNIVVRKTTKDRLDQIIKKNVTYNDFVNKLIDNYENGNK